MNRDVAGAFVTAFVIALIIICIFTLYTWYLIGVING